MTAPRLAYLYHHLYEQTTVIVAMVTVYLCDIQAAVYIIAEEINYTGPLNCQIKT